MIARLWAKWKPLAKRIGDFQARVILSIVYFLILGPYGVVVGLFKDPLKARRRPPGSLWESRPQEPVSLEAARRQY